MPNRTTTEREIIEIIMDCMFDNMNVLVPKRYHKRYPGITLNEVKQDHICNLIIDSRAEQFSRLNEEIEYSSMVNYYNEIKKLGYSDCLSGMPERPAGENIFLTEYCSGLKWCRCKTAIRVDVIGVYINFGSIERTIMALKKCSEYGLTFTAEKLIGKIKDNINSGMYDLHVDDDDLYI